MNKFFKFPDNEPDTDELHIWWNKESKQWEIWFGEDLPMFADGEYTPFREKVISYRRIKE